MTTIPQTIPFSLIDLGERGRTIYRGIEELAESLEHNGLIQPIVLSPILGYMNEEEQTGPIPCDALAGSDRYLLIAGGRRYHALKSLGVTELYHGVTSTPGLYGFILKEEQGTALSNLLTEIAENLDRDDVDWRDNCAMIIRAAKLLRKDAAEKGHLILMRDLGAILGCGYQDMRAAELVHADLVAHPEDYKDIPSLRAAVAVLMKKQAKYMEGLLVERTMKPNEVLVEPSQEERINSDAQEFADNVWNRATTPQPTTIPLSSKFSNCDGLTWLKDHSSSVDHIICDPDFAVSVEQLEAGVSGAAEGVAQTDTVQSLFELSKLFNYGFTAMKDSGFLVLFYDLDHHEKLQMFATAAGFAVQRWPLIWHKLDYRSNASPQSNFTKNMEYIMVCRKPGTVLAVSPQMSSIFPCPSGPTTKEYGHPFAKPPGVWKWIFNACCSKGQTVFDPFVGSGSSVIPALEFGLDAYGCEIQEPHYNSLILNLQRYYKKTLGENVRFE